MFRRCLTLLLSIAVAASLAVAQQADPVERQVANPITDTPNINPVSPDQSIKPPTTKKVPSVSPEGGDGELVVYSDKQTVSGEPGKRVVVHEGNVDVRYGMYRMQADRITIFEAEDRLSAAGSVIFDQGDDQRITGATAEWNYRTKLGYFIDSTGFTNQTNDGTVLYFTADRVERTSLTEILVLNGKFTACEEAVPKWSFTAKRAVIKANDRVRLRSAKFRVKDIPLVAAPFLSIPIKKRDRASGFLTPTFGYSAAKGAHISGAYYQTLGPSADITVRGDLYTGRGFGYGADLRTRSNSRSYLNFGFFAVKDRVLGPRAGPTRPDQGGSTVYAEGVQYFPNGFVAAVDVRLTSNLAFRQVFLEGIQQIISPIEVSQAFVSKSWSNYTLSLLARSQEITIPNVRIKSRNLPSVTFEKRPSLLKFFPYAYLSFIATAEGISRREEAADPNLYSARSGGPPVVTPALGQRFDVHPLITVPFATKYVNFTLTAGGRVTYYSNSFNDMRRVVSRDVIRRYGEITFDVRPVALAKNYYDKNGGLRFRHVIEPFLTYRFVRGVDNFARIIRYDHTDTATDTNEIEYGVTNRFYTRKYGQAVTKEAREKLRTAADADKKGISIQPYEVFSLTVRGKYFFDPRFGGALIPGRRNQIDPITSLTFYTFGGIPRRFSPLDIEATYRPQRTMFISGRADIGLQGEGLRQLSATVGLDTRLLKLYQTLYYTRRVTLLPPLSQYADAAGNEAGTLKGAQWSPSVFVGDRNKGLFGGTSLFFDFENRRGAGRSPLVRTLVTVGYAYDCCSLSLQYYNFNIGARREDKFVFSFRLNGIGSFGTEQIGQGLR